MRTLYSGAEPLPSLLSEELRLLWPSAACLGCCDFGKDSEVTGPRDRKVRGMERRGSDIVGGGWLALGR